MRIVVLDHTAQEGGAELALLRLARELRDSDGMDVRVQLFADGPLVERLADAGVPVEVVALDPEVVSASRASLAKASALRSAWAAARHVPRVVRALRRSGTDLVVANSLKSAVYAAVAAPLAGRRWVWHLHDRLADDYLGGVARRVMRALAAVGPRVIVANSQSTRATLPRMARSRTRVAYPGLDDDVFATRAEAAHPPVVGIVGRLSPTKGQRDFLLAAARVAPQHPSVRFQVVGGALFGEDDYADGLATLAAELGLADRVDFTGWVSDPTARLTRLSLLVHASPVPEPFGQVVAEAMAVGVPVIATAAGGIREILAPPADAGRGSEPYGLLVPPGDVGALAAGMAAVLDDPASAATRAEAARVAAGRFTITATADAVRAAWVDALPRVRRKAAARAAGGSTLPEPKVSAR